MNRRSLFGLFPTALLAPLGIGAASAAEEKAHRVAIHVDQNDPAVMNLALGNAKNLYEYYHERGEELEIEIVTYSQGLHMLRADTSPVKDRIKELRALVKKTTFSACGNTKRNMEKTEGKQMTLIPEARVVPSGIVRLVELQEQGWSYVRP
jgi:intracellular sulfur oxidation DsrE/DsrF family protein